jgi:hypothetical protein
MTLVTVPDRPIADAARNIALNVQDERMRDRVLLFADAVEAAIEAGQQERLAEILSGGTDMLTLWRLLEQLQHSVDAQRRELLAKSEMLTALQNELEAVKAECISMHAAQEPEALELRLRALEGRSKGGSPAERAAGIVSTITTLMLQLFEIQHESLEQIAAAVQMRQLDAEERAG